MKVLVTGAGGFIGHHVQAALGQAGHEMVPYDRPSDVADARALMKAGQDTGAVIHLAGVLGTSELLRGQHEAVTVNIAGTLNVLEVAAVLKIPVVVIGTGHKGQPNTYAITKGCAEDLALARAQWLGEKITVVRAFHVYGAGQKPPAPWGRSPVRKIFPAFACQALTGQPVEVYGSGNQVIDLVHASEVARVLAEAISGPYGTVTEAGTGKPVTVTRAAADILAAADPAPDTSAGWRPDIVYLPMRPGEPPDAVVVAGAPACSNPWPYLVGETVDWYRQWLASHS